MSTKTKSHKGQWAWITQAEPERDKERERDQWEGYAAMLQPDIQLILHQPCHDRPGHYTCKLKRETTSLPDHCCSYILVTLDTSLCISTHVHEPLGTQRKEAKKQVESVTTSCTLDAVSTEHVQYDVAHNP